MKFTDTLKSLEAKACASDGTADFVVDHFLYANYLTRHAQEIINLVEAAEKISANIADSSSLRVWFEDLIALKNTVAALNKEPPKEIDPNKWAFDRKLESY